MHHHLTESRHTRQHTLQTPQHQKVNTHTACAVGDKGDAGLHVRCPLLRSLLQLRVRAGGTSTLVVGMWSVVRRCRLQLVAHFDFAAGLLQGKQLQGPLLPARLLSHVAPINGWCLVAGPLPLRRLPNYMHTITNITGPSIHTGSLLNVSSLSPITAQMCHATHAPPPPDPHKTTSSAPPVTFLAAAE